jgi:hypothetical protein
MLELAADITELRDIYLNVISVNRNCCEFAYELYSSVGGVDFIFGF